MKKKQLKEVLKNKAVILDGGMGTLLQKSGMPAGASPEAWALKNPEVLSGIHGEYIEAGAQVIYTCTFGANRLKLKGVSSSGIKEINKNLAEIAVEAAGNKAFVAGDIGPTGRIIKPAGDLGFEEAVNIFKEQAKGLLLAGVDLFVIETMMDIQEARAALIAVREVCDKFVMVSMTYEKNGRTLNGTDPVTALITLQSLGAGAVGCNCSAGPEGMLGLVSLMKPYAKVPIFAKPNAGIPRLSNGKTVFDMKPGKFASFAGEFLKRGANMLGGCCGTTPEHIRGLSLALKGRKALPVKRDSLSALSSVRSHVIMEGKKRLFVIGEKINPTGKKAFQEELRKGVFSYVRQQAGEQEVNGACVLDVNVGLAGADEGHLMNECISLLSVISALPVVVDSSDIKVVERAIRLYPGRVLINSISGEKEKLRRLLPVAAKYGSMFILLPLNDKGVPHTLVQRKSIIKEVFARAKRLGFSSSDIIVDGLVLSVSSSPKAPGETLKTIKWSADSLGVNTVIGLSNVSFGVPNRRLVNSVFLSMARKAGLTCAIADPAVLTYKPVNSEHVKKAVQLLSAKDKNARDYIAFFSDVSSSVKTQAKEKGMSAVSRVFHCVLDGNRDDIEGCLLKAINSGVKPSELMESAMIPAITKAGELFDRKEYFLPQLIASAESMKAGFGYLRPLLKKDSRASSGDPSVILATVQGDIHDIGKNIVALMFENHGFNVIDLGKDVPAGKIISAIEQNNPDLVGLSALMTTTMVRMKEVIDMARGRQLKCPFIVGGAVLNSRFARSLGAEYAGDAVEAVRVAKRLIN